MDVLQMFSLSKVVKVAKVPLLDDGALSASVTFLVPDLAKLCVQAKNGHLILFFAFGKSIYPFCDHHVSHP